MKGLDQKQRDQLAFHTSMAKHYHESALEAARSGDEERANVCARELKQHVEKLRALSLQIVAQ